MNAHDDSSTVYFTVKGPNNSTSTKMKLNNNAKLYLFKNLTSLPWLVVTFDRSFSGISLASL